MLNDFEKEIICTYKGETYSVRDNGAIMRHPRIDKKPRPSDNIWTFGKYNVHTGYAEFAGERVHRIVATAFHGKPPSQQYVVDHIDTNRRNNRPENLRWITKLENILLNPITCRRIELTCGSVEEFLKDPSKLQKSCSNRDFEWMRAVTKEEAAYSLERMLNWAKSDKLSFGGSLGEWVYQRTLSDTKNQNSIYQIIKDSILTPEESFLKTQQSTFTSPLPYPLSNQQETGNQPILYRTRLELSKLIKSLLESNKKVKLPAIVLRTAGKGIIIKEEWTEEFQKCEYRYEGKSRIPKSVILQCKDSSVALLIRFDKKTAELEKNTLIALDYNIVEIDLSGAKDGVTETEMEHTLQTATSKKIWLYHKQITQAKNLLQKVCEPISDAGSGVCHSYSACPLYGDSVEDLECLYCNYRTDSDFFVDDEPQDCCFGKSMIQTYEDLLSVSNVEKEDRQIISITFNKNGQTDIKRFDKKVQLPGKTIFQLWNEKKCDVLIAYNIYSCWYVLIENDPQLSYNKNGCVYGKISKNLDGLKNNETRSIYSFDSDCWKIVTES